jgi:hypothetical protein
MPINGLPYDSVVMRELGQSYVDKGFFEVNLGSGAIEWANDFVLSKHGMTLIQIQAMTLHDLIPSEHHDSLNNTIADESNGKSQKFSIWPEMTSDGRLVWWYISKAKDAHPYHWYKAEYLNTTDKSGPEYANMLAAMNTANSYNDLASKFNEHQTWIKGEIKRIDDTTTGLRQGQIEMQEQLKGCLSAANRAANEAMVANKKIDDIKTNIEDQFSKQTTAILNLISTDAIHEQRMASFEIHMKKAASDASTEAVSQISASAEKAGKAITTQAHKAGQGLAKRVTIPVGAIAALFTFLQWLITNWPHK